MNKEVQKERIKNYFIAAAKEIVSNDGVAKVSIRKTADLAGYSYATIYNYFTDLNHLLWHVAMSCIEDMVKDIYPLLENTPYHLEDVKNIYQAYISYCLKNSKHFELIFFNQLGNTPADFEHSTNTPFLALGIITNLEANIAVTEKDKSIVAEIISTSVHGQLALHFSGKTDKSPDEIINTVNTMLDYLLSSK